MNTPQYIQKKIIVNSIFLFLVFGNYLYLFSSDLIYHYSEKILFFTPQGYHFHNRRSSESRLTVNIFLQFRLKGETEQAESYDQRLLKFCLSDRGMLMASVRRSRTYGYENLTPSG
jgi:hypothetical protein